MNCVSINEKLRRRAIFICCLVLLSVFLCGCGSKELNLYKAGIEVTSCMETLLKDETYVYSLFGGLELDIKNYIASDYDSPTKVYSISKHDADKVEELFGTKKENLSEAAKEQIRFYAESFEYVLSVIRNKSINNSIADAYQIAFINTFCCHKVYKNCSLKEEIAYFYAFETGKPILVCFEQINGDVYASGYFFPIDTTLSALRDLFEPYGIKVDIIER